MRPPRRRHLARRDEDEDEDDDEGAMRRELCASALKRDGGDALRAASASHRRPARRLERVAPEKIYNWPRRFCLQLRRPRWDGDRVD